ncbi:hypothetical protein GJAV_G00235290 [Gymnothorax javanicus]|nr:hypothetical protein GJAV_G00235290 [Gymnothorax javanicus]
MKAPSVSEGGEKALWMSPLAVSQCHSISSSLEDETRGAKGHATKRKPSKIKRVERRKAVLQKMMEMKKKRRALRLMFRCPREIGQSTDPNPLGKGSEEARAEDGEQWELDSGFCSEVSPPNSGRSSPCARGVEPAQLVAMDCEMVGTGLEGRCSELARCSLVSYHGDVLYDQYVQPQQPVTDYRTPWSGIRHHHLLQAVPFVQAREEILQILQGKVVVGHALHNDFRALGFIPPSHMIRDTSRARILRRLSGMSAKGSVSLKNLAKTLLNRDIQVGKRGHSSVEDALAAMDLYRLVETQWEQDVLSKPRDPAVSPSLRLVTSPTHYMQDQYWPAELVGD